MDGQINMRKAITAFLTVIGLLAAAGAFGGGNPFSAAEPVWPQGRERELNSAFRFQCRFRAGSGDKPVLKVTAAYNYRVKLNGRFVGYGPVRAQEGVFRVDEWPLAADEGFNDLVIESSGYNCNSYYFINQPSFLAAEVVAGGKVLAATGENGGFAVYESSRIRKVPRYSGQRTFIDAWRVGCRTPAAPALKRIARPVKFEPRPLAYPDFALDRSFKPLYREKLERNESLAVKKAVFIERDTRPHRQQFPPAELETNPYYELQRYGRKSVSDGNGRLSAPEAVIFEGGKNSAGFIGIKAECATACRIVVAFDEMLTGGKVDFTRLSSAQVAEWRIEEPGVYELETFEPYVAKCLKVAVLEGEASVPSAWVRTYVSPLVRARFSSSDPRLDSIFRAAAESYRANAVDGFTDCPSRERAYWSGDTFFTARASSWLTGNREVERLFLANFLLKDGAYDFSKYDSRGVDMTGAIPAMYPSSIVWSNFIPNYTMWLVMQLEEYVERYDDREFAELAKPKVMGALSFFSRFLNSDGLLEKLPGWVFVEWSRANKLVQDVNYPSNMMYARMLEAVAELYSMPELAARAEAVRREVVRQSWNGEWFCDNALRQPDGTLKLSGECTETCQYCAFFFNTVTPKTHRALWNRLLNDFGPDRVAEGRHAKIWPANFIFGTCERLELLSRAGRQRQIVDETRGFFFKMAEKTGTLWEHLDPRASCCHGFSSIAAEYMLRDVLGVRRVDRKNKTVEVSPAADMPLEWCEGAVPVGDGEISVKWRRDGKGKTVKDVKLPPGWREASF